jgi:eukaryotic-like serine/threonine-protein kinase
VSATTFPAYQLAGLALDGGWHVASSVLAPPPTGGCFSVGYHVEKADGTKGFLKALDYSRALQSEDPPTALKPLIDAFEHERNLLTLCRANRMSHIATAITHGAVDVPGGGLLSRVSYLIFERADRDARAHLALAQQFDAAWRLRSLHNVAVALRQLHSREIAHQDLKPSNVLVFGNLSKVADLGRASQFGVTAPHDGDPFAGDPQYTPIEVCYGQVDPDWRRRRLGADLYLFGSLIHFFFAQIGMTSAFQLELNVAHHPSNWGDSWVVVLPHVRDAFQRICRDFESIAQQSIGTDAAELTTLVRYLCEPDVALRGHPLNRGNAATQFSLERFISRLDVLAGRAEMGLFRR